jgi:hypothetical protein
MSTRYTKPTAERDSPIFDDIKAAWAEAISPSSIPDFGV